MIYIKLDNIKNSIDMKVVQKTCPWCGTVNSVEMTDEQYNQYTSGDGLIQHIFPNLSAATREILITGICPTCWDNTFK